MKIMNTIKRKQGNLFNNFAKSFFDDDFSNLFTLKPFFNDYHDIGLVNIKETEKEYQFNVSVPGFKKDDIDIEINNDTLTISSEVSKSNKSDDSNFTYREFYKSSFKRSFKVPDDVDIDNIDANMEDGILNIKIKKLKIKNNKISIKVK
jgi:HSP20 family protein